MMRYRNLIWILLNVIIGVDIAFSQEAGALRLAGTGSNATQGRVEIFHEGAWGTVCKDFFSNAAAIVTCRQLGFPDPNSAIAVTDLRFGAGTGAIFMDNVACGGAEKRLDQCQFNGWGNTDCSHAEDVGVICPTSTNPPPSTIIPPTTKAPVVPSPDNCDTPDPNPSIRIIGPEDKPGVGVIQVKRDNQWGTVCDDDWDVLDAIVVCRTLCFEASKSLAGSIEFNTQNISEPMTINNVQCTGNEATFDDCQQSQWSENSCGRNEMARVTCTAMNNEAPSKPQPILECNDGYLTAHFSRTRDPHMREEHLLLNDTSYDGRCNVIRKSDDDFVTIQIPFDECGTSKTSNSTHIIYRNAIKKVPTHTVGDVNFINTYIVTVSCELPRDVFADKPLEPLTETVTQSAPGEFIVNMHFYRDNSFSVAVMVFPLQIPLGEWLNTALELIDVDDTLRLVIPNCYATPTADKNSTIRYPLFTDKCIDDQSVGFFPINNTWWGYRYQTFKFVAYSEVHIHCDAFICDQDDTSDECDRSCFPATTTQAATSAAPNRKKRSFARRYTHVTSPAIVVMDMNSPTGIVRPVHTTAGAQTSTDKAQTSTVKAQTSTYKAQTSTVVTSRTSTQQEETVTVKTAQQSTFKPNVDGTSSTKEVEFSKTEASVVDVIYVSGNHANQLYKTSHRVYVIIMLLLAYLSI